MCGVYAGWSSGKLASLNEMDSPGSNPGPATNGGEGEMASLNRMPKTVTATADRKLLLDGLP